MSAQLRVNASQPGTNSTRCLPPDRSGDARIRSLVAFANGHLSTWCFFSSGFGG